MPLRAGEVPQNRLPRLNRKFRHACVGGSSGSDGSLAGSYAIEHLPRALLVRLGAPESPVRACAARSMVRERFRARAMAHSAATHPAIGQGRCSMPVATTSRC
ncbi:MAG: hypothetical protein IPH43_14385 [Xanthomonadales bacterium]|nr:hypothetical protein [Xanthomonadales bacterium]